MKCVLRIAAMVGAALFVGAMPAGAALITVGGDPIGGGQLVSSTFTIGKVSPDNNAAIIGNLNEFPISGGENPSNAIDGTDAKYLNFAAQNTGYIVTPVGGLSNVTGIHFETANDSENRDPASYSLYGSTTAVASTNPGDTYNLAAFTLISSDGLSLPSGRNDGSLSVSFANPGSYKTYILVFPTMKGPPSDGGPPPSQLMQIGEAALTGSFVPEPSSVVLLGFGAVGLLAVARRRRK